mmetsp:Transcript_54710/g.151764  ORF Transcript_54710/g.151764 Transcript_54710/m.151764 type:complete len:247 (-) Transcript_54710:286-1026(-)
MRWFHALCPPGSRLPRRLPLGLSPAPAQPAAAHRTRPRPPHSLRTRRCSRRQRPPPQLAARAQTAQGPPVPPARRPTWVRPPGGPPGSCPKVPPAAAPSAGWPRPGSRAPTGGTPGPPTGPGHRGKNLRAGRNRTMDRTLRSECISPAPPARCTLESLPSCMSLACPARKEASSPCLEAATSGAAWVKVWRAPRPSSRRSRCSSRSSLPPNSRRRRHRPPRRSLRGPPPGPLLRGPPKAPSSPQPG